MSAVAETRPAARAVPRRARRAAGSSLGGILWIAALAAMLAGVVAVNVLVLQLNVRLDGLGRERAQLKADIATTRAQLSSASAASLIQRRASAELGLVPADPALTTYVQLEP
jgi:cell division protein FtsB